MSLKSQASHADSSRPPCDAKSESSVLPGRIEIALLWLAQDRIKQFSGILDKIASEPKNKVGRLIHEALSNLSNLANIPLPLSLEMDQNGIIETCKELATKRSKLSPKESLFIPGLWYEQEISIRKTKLDIHKTFHSRRKREGIFYTPIWLVDSIVESAFENSVEQGAKPIRVLDPACGSGAFLIGSLLYLKNKIYGDKKISQEQYLDLFRRSIFGVDRDPSAILLTKWSIFFTSLDGKSVETNTICPLREGNIFTGDSLIESDRTGECSSSHASKFSWNDAFTFLRLNEGFDVIVGNPPYGISRNDQISEAENRILRRRYKAFCTGKANKYILFLARSCELLSSKGSLCFVVPNSWLGIKSAVGLRSYLLNNNLIESVSTYSYPVFADPKLEVVVLQLRKGRERESFVIQNSNNPASHSVIPRFKIPRQNCLRKSDCTIPLIWSEKIEKILNRIDQISFPLGSNESPFLSRIALQAYATGKGTPRQTKADIKNRSFDYDFKFDESTYRYLKGSDVQRYKLKWSGTWLRWGPWLAEPQKLEYFRGSRVIVREILAPFPYILTAAYTDLDYLYNKSALHVLLKAPKYDANDKNLLLALSGILNSRLASLVVRTRGKKSQRRLFPKILNEDLMHFPCSTRIFESARDLADLVSNMNSARFNAIELQQEIDSAVCLIYGIELNEVVTLDNELQLSLTSSNGGIYDQ
ncbi:MAG: N-6 DNA methylase [Bdellovibrionales bacterium]|nr:N-6 DNA methylase [Bdellovibrionales bacterium]